MVSVAVAFLGARSPQQWHIVCLPRLPFLFSPLFHTEAEGWWNRERWQSGGRLWNGNYVLSNMSTQTTQLPCTPSPEEVPDRMLNLYIKMKHISLSSFKTLSAKQKMIPSMKSKPELTWASKWWAENDLLLLKLLLFSVWFFQVYNFIFLLCYKISFKW